MAAPDADGVLADGAGAAPAPPATPHGDVYAEERVPQEVSVKSPRVPDYGVDVRQGDAAAGDGGVDVRGVGVGAARRELVLEDCYPARREDEVRALRRQRDQHYQLDLLRQIEDKRRDKLQRRREDVRGDLQRLGRQERSDEYLRRLHDEQQQQLRQQLRQQLQREEHREEQRMRQVAESRSQQREQLRGQQAPAASAAPLDPQLEMLSERLERQHLPDDAAAAADTPADEGVADTDAAPAPVDAEGPPSRPSSKARPRGGGGRGEPADIVAGVTEAVKLDGQRPWNHYRPLQKELDRRRQERAAAAAARDAVAARNAEANAHARMDVEYRRYLDWRLRTRRAGRPAELSPRMEAARRWGEARRQAALQQRADRDGHLAEWRRAKDLQDRERRRAASAAQQAAQQAAADKQRRAHDCFTRWLDTIHERKLASENAGPVGATGVTTYEAFHAVPWSRAGRAGQRQGQGQAGRKQ